MLAVMMVEKIEEMEERVAEPGSTKKYLLDESERRTGQTRTGY